MYLAYLLGPVVMLAASSMTVIPNFSGYMTSFLASDAGQQA